MSGLLNPNISSIVGWVKLGLLVLEYGYKIVKFLLEKYNAIEKEAEVVDGITSDQKANSWNNHVLTKFLFAKERTPGRSELNKLRETVWAAKNPGKIPKPLKDPRLRVRGKKPGKAR